MTTKTDANGGVSIIAVSILATLGSAVQAVAPAGPVVVLGLNVEARP